MSDSNIPLHIVFVEAWIKKGDKYLLAQRHPQDDQAAGKWTAPGGKVEMELEGDILENTLKREVMEEVGVEIENFRLLSNHSFIRSSGHYVVVLSFLADYKSGEARPLDDQAEVRWVTLDEMERLLDKDWVEILRHLREVEGK